MLIAGRHRVKSGITMTRLCNKPTKLFLLSSILVCCCCFIEPTLGMSILSAVTTTNASSKIPPRVAVDVVIVGGGPVGLATALTLSHPPHNCDVCLIESNPMVNYYDPTKAFLYNVNARGQKFIKRFPLLHQKLIDSAVESRGIMSNFMIIPGDPSIPLPTVTKDGKIPEKIVSGLVNPGIEAAMKATEAGDEEQDNKISFWIPRHDMTRIMKEVAEEENLNLQKKKANNEQNVGSLSILSGMECLDVLPSSTNSTANDDGYHGVEVVVKDTTNNQITTYHSNLVVGADGYKSIVRNSLGHTSNRSSDENKFHSNKLWPNIPSGKFQLKRYKSPATGLRIKVLQLPPQFEITNVNSTTLTTQGNFIYGIRGMNKGPTDYLNLGLLPVRDNNAIRPANIITRPNHIVWTLKTGDEVREWFAKNFPRMNFAASSAVSQQEWDRFAAAEGTRFPHCQYSNGIALSSLDKRSGVVLVGDAIHSYPPDIGQGVNSGLADVLALGEALKNVDFLSSRTKIAKNNASFVMLGDALEKFDRDRLKETKALVHLARIGAPYQYRQPLLVDKIGVKLWTANIILRVALNKATFGLVPPAAVQLTNLRPDLSFHQVMCRANTVTFVLGTLGSFLLKRIGVTLWRLIVKK